MKTLKIDLPSY